jgi:3-methyladenine DNA glycosylase AlkD
MNLTSKAQKIHAQISAEGAKMGDLRKIAKEVKKDHKLALELWSTREFMPRQLAILIMDRKQIDPDLVDQLFHDMQNHAYNERNYMADWLMANQLAKDKALISIMFSWENSPLALQRRIFWYYQARLRWTGKIPLDNSELLLTAIEERMAKRSLKFNGL